MATEVRTNHLNCHVEGKALESFPFPGGMCSIEPGAVVDPREADPQVPASDSRCFAGGVHFLYCHTFSPLPSHHR